jgi:hypothetical protein
LAVGDRFARGKSSGRRKPSGAHGIRLDRNTLDQVRHAARSVGLTDAEIERAINRTGTTRES